MSSFSDSAHSANPPHTNLSPGFRFHASSDNLRRREAGPVSDPRLERRRSTVSGPDRKRRLVNPEVAAGTRYVRPSAIGSSSSSRAEMDSRPIQSSSSHLQPETPRPGSSYETAIDISSSPPEPPTLDRRRSSLSRRDSQYGADSTRPRWQPDSEVTECPICGAAFSFWYRKHHCRKCGRVVCASCSPHRITIPRQYIVHPPTAIHPSASALAHRATQMINLEGDEPTQSPVAFNPALGGGEEVRLCNPCVPDPNPEPPHGYPPVRASGELGSGAGWVRHRSYHSMSNPSRQHPFTPIPDVFTSRPTRRTVGSSDYPAFTGFGGPHAPSLQGRPISYGSMSSSRMPPLNPGRHSFHYPYGAVSGSHPEPSGSSMSIPRVSRGSHSRPSRPVDECDACPICDNPLPPIGVNGNEDAREAHIRGCIENHGRPASGSPVSPSPVPVRMLAFTATEKDCIGQDGTEQECTICMEEYEVGQSLVRLECLCKFHKRCIVEWFERKKECPVHKTS
ncbi:Putative FYVE finger-containing protein [Aspergillus calidoustus]|uniref:RING-type E3 ubiquitin transferase n=1 Tax=Aspergillus calidoustus TaxID=454130 RepID=A0A0U5G898_ASPCI|nr:Putative FYVE finger-containing protein [Aspergillus calidoustus]